MLALSISTGATAFAATRMPDSTYLKKGNKNSTVTLLQQRLTEIGYFTVSPTGYFGDITKNAIKSFQLNNGLKVDGIVGRNTIATMNSLSDIPKEETVQAEAEVASAKETESNYNTNTLDWTWFGNVNSFIPRGADIKILDINSGEYIDMNRSYGSNHADCEALTAADTAKLKSVIGGSWTWTRRPVVVFYDGYAIPASLAPYPHAGNDKAKATAYTSWRSGGYGGGANLDAVKNNSMNGVVDIHFLGSKTHGSNRVEPKHQATVKAAAEYIKNNMQ